MSAPEEPPSPSYDGHHVTVCPEPQQAYREAAEPLGNAPRDVRDRRVAAYRLELAALIRAELEHVGFPGATVGEEGTIHAVPVGSAPDMRALRELLSDVFPRDWFLVGEWSVGEAAVKEVDALHQARLADAIRS